MPETQFLHHLYEVGLYLNTSLCQSPADISKTEKAIQYIKHFGINGRIQNGLQENGVHHITIVLTNNNLMETTQWACRIDKKLRHLNAMILSSRADSDIKHLDTLWGHLARLTKPDDLPDLLIMCTNEKRVSDIVDIITTIKNKILNLTKIGIHRISLSIMFDEADKNIRLIVACLKAIWPLLTWEELKKDDTIRDFHFITATPLKEFWKQLKKCGIDKLRNVNQAIASMDENSVLHSDYVTLMQQYRYLDDHEKNHEIDVMTMDPVEYASLKLAKWGPHTSQHPRIVFAPSDIEIITHDAMRNLFLRAGYFVFVTNGKTKGFYDTRGSFQSLEDFRTAHNVHGELYEVFQKWRLLHPTESLAITGCLNLLRGITFNTIGFNFTNMILSACHMRNLADLLQVAGRGSGDKNYVGRFVMDCPKKLWETTKEQIDLLDALFKKNLEEFEAKHFSPQKGGKEKEVAWTVPLVFDVGETAYATIKKVGRSKVWDVESIFAVISDAGLVDDLRKRKAAGGQFQITQPDSKKSEENSAYKKYVTDFQKKAEEGRVFIMGLKKDQKNKDGYQIFLDEKNYKIVVSVYNGTRLPVVQG